MHHLRTTLPLPLPCLTPCALIFFSLSLQTREARSWLGPKRQLPRSRERKHAKSKKKFKGKSCSTPTCAFFKIAILMKCGNKVKEAKRRESKVEGVVNRLD